MFRPSIVGIWLIAIAFFCNFSFLLYLGLTYVGKQQRKEKDKFYTEYCAFMDKHYDKISADELWTLSKKCKGKWKR